MLRHSQFFLMGALYRAIYHFMFMQSDTKSWRGNNLSRLDTLYRGVNAPAFHLKLAGVLHNDFGDYPLLSPLSALLPERGKLKGKRTLHIVNTYTLAFFDRYLKNQPSSLLNGSSIDYPEVDFKSHFSLTVSRLTTRLQHDFIN